MTVNGRTLTPAQAEVYTVLKDHGPLPDHVLVPVVQHTGRLHQASSGIRTRRKELTDFGLLDAVSIVHTASGREAVTWTVV